jgi:hypothetical protein
LGARGLGGGATKGVAGESGGCGDMGEPASGGSPATLPGAVHVCCTVHAGICRETACPRLTTTARATISPTNGVRPATRRHPFMRFLRVRTGSLPRVRAADARPLSLFSRFVSAQVFWEGTADSSSPGYAIAGHHKFGRAACRSLDYAEIVTAPLPRLRDPATSDRMSSSSVGIHRGEAR